MSGRQLKVDLIANTSQFKSAMNETSQNMKNIKSEMKATSSETDKYGNSVQNNETRLKQLNGIMGQHRTRVQAIKNEQKHVTDEYKKGNITLKQHDNAQRNLSTRLNNTNAQMNKTEAQIKRLNTQAKRSTLSFKDFDNRFRNIGTNMRNVVMQVGIVAGVGFTALKRVLGNVVDEAMSFESQMAEVEAVSGATGDEMEALTQQAKDFGKETIYTSQDVAKAQSNLARAGFNVEETMGAMAGMLDLAASSNMDLGEASDITSNIIRGFNMEAEESGRVADVLAKGASTANTDVKGLGDGISVVAPIAADLGLEIEGLSAGLATMADNGIEGQQSGRMLRQGFLRLSKPTGEAKDLIEELGINVFDADGNMKDLDKVVGELEKGLEGQTKKQRAAALATIFGSESTAGWTALIEEGEDSLNEYTGQLENSEGAASEMADTMQDTAAGAVKRMESALSGLKLELGEKLLPILADGAEYVADFASGLADMDDETIETIAKMGLLATAVLGVTTIVAGITAAIGALLATTGLVGVAIVGGTALLGTLAAALKINSDRTKRLAEEQRQGETNARRYGEGLSEGTLEGVKGYTDLYEGAKIKMHELKTMSGKEAKNTSAEVTEAFGQMADMVVEELESQKSQISDAINEVLSVAGESGTKKAAELTSEVIAELDEDIAEYTQAVDVLKEADQEYANNASKMPDAFRQKYEEALKVVEGGSREFAQTQDEMLAIQQNISERQGSIMFEDAQSYYERVQDTYDKSIRNANQFYDEKSDLFEQQLTQGRITEEEYGLLMAGVESKTNQMLFEASKSQEESLKILTENVDARGQMLDLETGRAFERLQERDRYNNLQTESDAQYLQRWLEHTKETLSSQNNFSKEALSTQKENLEALKVKKEASNHDEKEPQLNTSFSA